MTSKWILSFSLFSSFLLTAVYASPEKFKQTGGLDTQQIERLTGAKGQFDPQEKVFKVFAPRADLKVEINGVKFTPDMGLTSWAAFKMLEDHAMVMGDLVLTENQVNPVMTVVLDVGLHITSLHNHFLLENPRIMFMHIEGMNGANKLAGEIGKVFAAINATSNDKSDIPYANIDPAKTQLTTSKIDAILNKKGTLKDGVYKVEFGRVAKMEDFSVGSTMGINTWAAFVGTDEQAVVDGDFAMYESEMHRIVFMLHRAGFNIVAIHQQLTDEQPRIIFLHYYGIGKAEVLAKALRAALNIQGVK